MTSFSDLTLLPQLLKALSDEGYRQPTPIQSQAIPPLLDGRDLLGCARTGTGKTAAFALPILHRLATRKRAAPRKSARTLVIVPTRELAAQVAESFTVYGRHLRPTVALVYGGVGQGPQVKALAPGVDVLVATPGRLLDLIGQGFVRLDGVETLVLDEADQMLDLGFLPDVKRILALVPKKRQTLLFSATMPPVIEELAQRILHSPEKVFVTPAATTAELVDQRVQFASKADKPAALEKALRDPAVKRALVFTRTKRGCDRVAKRLIQSGIPAQAIHGDKSQGNRERSLAGFRQGRIRVLVATDIAARGIDVDGITHVVNFEIPNVPETYVHRIGRTARAGAAGVALSLCAPDERAFLRDIERLIKRPLSGESRREEPSPQPARRARAATGQRPSGKPRERHGNDRRAGGGSRSSAPAGRIPHPVRHSARREAPLAGPGFGAGV